MHSPDELSGANIVYVLLLQHDDLSSLQWQLWKEVKSEKVLIFFRLVFIEEFFVDFGTRCIKGSYSLVLVLTLVLSLSVAQISKILFLTFLEIVVVSWILLSHLVLTTASIKVFCQFNMRAF